VKFNIIFCSVRKSFTTKFGWLKNSAINKASNESVEKFNICTPSIKQTVKNLSRGNQQKVAIAKWLIHKCDILIFDEPTRGIDVGAKDEIYKLLKVLTSQGKSIIMISSELPEVLRLSDRIVVMCKGEVTGILENSSADQNIIMQYATRNQS